MQISFKVDVDTRKGLERGVPNLLRIFENSGISASFFIPMGPDRTGRTIRRIFTKPGIIAKAKRTNALRIYGLPTLLYGTLLPSPSVVGRRNRDLLLAIGAKGHEVGIHGYDHFKWQDFISRMSEEAIELELKKADFEFRKIFEKAPGGFAAPGWQCNKAAQTVIDRREFMYTSNTRGRNIYFPQFERWHSRTMEIPTTLPTLDELRIPQDNAGTEKAMAGYFRLLNRAGLNVYTLHAEIEGMICQDFLIKFIKALRRENASFLRLDEISKNTCIY